MELNNYKRWFSVRYEDFLAERKINMSQVDEDVRYEKITDVICVEVSEFEFFFFKDGALQIIYISNEELTQRLWNEFKLSFNEEAPEKKVRSRAGKTSNQLIFATQGFTASVKGNDADFIEIYSPCSVQDYLDNVYREPGAFIR
jgi:hypothetical protein